MWDSIIRFEIIFRGTLGQFVNEVRDLLENIIEDSGDVFFNHRAYEYRYKPGDWMTRVSFRNPDDQDAAKTGSIKATGLPGEKTLLQIWAPDEHWEELKPYWERLEDVMQRHGFIEGAAAAVQMPAKPGPKPKNPAERKKAVEQWNQIKDKGELTFLEWSQEMWGIHPDGSLKVPKSTFYSWYKQKK